MRREDAARNSTKRRQAHIYVGIDPGKTGAAAIINEYGQYVCSVQFSGLTPLEQADFFNREALKDAMGITVVVEEQRTLPHDGRVGAFTLGKEYGFMLGVVHAHEMRVTVVLPTRWKTFFGLLKQNKTASRIKAQSLWPNAPLRRPKDHNVAEALLLAEYGRLKEL